MKLSAGVWAMLGAAAVAAALGLGVLFLTGLNAAVAPGLGLRGAAIWSFGVTVALLVLFALVAGDGLVGEIQYVLPGFFVFFVFNWLMIAWVF